MRSRMQAIPVCLVLLFWESVHIQQTQLLIGNLGHNIEAWLVLAKNSSSGHLTYLGNKRIRFLGPWGFAFSLEMASPSGSCFQIPPVREGRVRDTLCLRYALVAVPQHVNSVSDTVESTGFFWCSLRMRLTHEWRSRPVATGLGNEAVHLHRWQKQMPSWDVSHGKDMLPEKRKDRTREK